MKEFINKKYLNKIVLEKIFDAFHKNEPIQYFVFDDFIDKKIYKEVEKEFINKNNNFNTVDERKNHFISNKSIIESGEKFHKLYNFFISNNFEQFLELIYKIPLKKYRKIESNFIENELWIKDAWVAQIYQKWDYMWWHTDIAKDMKREESIKKWWYKQWDNCIISKFDEIWAFIYYVYNSDDNWNEKKWWVLELWKVEKNDIITYKKVFPLRNRLVIIKSSNNSYHRVTEVLWKNDYRITLQDLLYDKNAIIWDEIL